MRYLSGNYYVEVIVRRYINLPTGKKILGLRGETNYHRTQYQVQNETQIRKKPKRY